MKNFFKKLSFVLAIAMVLTSLTPAVASAASKNFVTLKGNSSKPVTSVYAWIGGVTRNLDYNIGGKTSGVKGTWKSNNTKVVKVNASTGVLTPVANGTTTVTFTPSNGKNAVKTTVKVRTRAAALHIYDKAEYAAGNKVQLEEKEGVTPFAIELKVGETKELKVTMPLSKKQQNAGAKKASYFTYAEVGDNAIVEAVKDEANGDERAYTLNAKAVGETTVTIVANQTTQANVRNGKYFREAKITVKVVDGLTITDLKASKVNILTATFAAPVDTDDVNVTVTKGTNKVDATVAWNEDKTVATITTTAKMTVGTYTVTAASKTDETKKAEKSVEIENQYVAEIQILNDIALTGSKVVSGDAIDAMEAYVYYKVVDQYGEDLTASTSIQWSTSTGNNPEVQRSEGKLILTRSDQKAFTYGEQIYVTGVYTRTGVSVNATLTIGTAQALHAIEMAGFVKKNTTTLVQTLPSGFKSGEYYLVYDAVDQNGNALKADATYAGGTNNQITFISDNVLVIREIKGDSTNQATTVVLDGHEYNAIPVIPGEYVDRGGEVNITAIATRTGNRTVKNYVVGQNQILASFDMSDPAGTVADGETFEIPFRALDQNGDAITNFVTLSDNLNKLNFSVSEGRVELKEQNDGTAKLFYHDATINWNNSVATDGIDRTVSITSVVVGGSSDNQLLSISDKARPDAISSIALSTAYLEGDSVAIDKLNTFTFLDQYGRPMDPAKYGSKDNGFFQASASGVIPGNDFSDFKYDIVIEYKGSNLALTTGAVQASGDVNIIGSGITVNTAANTQTSLAGNTFNFAIAKARNANQADPTKYENVSPVKAHTFAVVDINQVRNFTVNDFAKQHVQTNNSSAQTGQLAGLKSDNVTGAALGATIPTGYSQTVVLKGTYNGASVTVPARYYTVLGKKVSATSGAVTLGENVIQSASSGAIKWSDLYDVTTSNYLRKDTTDTIKVTVYEVFSNGVSAASQPAMGIELSTNAPATNGGIILKDSVSKVITISDALPVVTTLNLPETYLVTPTDTGFTAESIWTAIDTGLHNSYGCIVLDQYGVHMCDKVNKTYKLSKIEEAAGYAENNFAVSGNDTASASATGAERGDTFVLTITAAKDGVAISKDINVTVGSDTHAILTDSANTYVDVLKKDFLEKQRLNTLQ